MNQIYLGDCLEWMPLFPDQSIRHDPVRPAVWDYRQPGKLVLDNCAGSGTTGVVCINTWRRFVLIEREEKYREICVKRCAEAEEKMRLTGAGCPR